MKARFGAQAAGRAGGAAIILAMVLAVTALAGAPRAQAQAKPDIPIETAAVSFAQVPSLVYAGVYVALDRGYFAARGLTVSLVSARGGDSSFQVAGGTVQFAGGSPDSAFFNSLDRHLPLIAIASLAMTGKEHSTTPLMVRKDLFASGAVTSVAQLRGRKVANLAPGGITEYLLGLSLKSGGLTLDDVAYVTPMGFAQMVDALTTKAVDAARIAEPFATMARQKGIAVVLDDTSDLNEEILWIQMSADYASRHPNIVTNFLIGYLEGARDVTRLGYGNPEIGKIIEKFTKVSPDITAAAVPPVVPPDGAMSVDSIMRQQAFHMSRGHLTYKILIPAERFLDRSYLDKAVAFLGPYKG